jgi:RimJ/RimL family protein N-acetyltransferase
MKNEKRRHPWRRKKIIDNMDRLLYSIKMVDIKECNFEDITILAEMNKQLIEDEKANNPMGITELKNRMNGFLNNGYKAFKFIMENEIIGYALCDITKEPIYLRQFFIKREIRRKHYGKESFNKLLKKLRIKEIEIDVYKWNEVGTRFWESLGFREQWKRMKYQKR